MHCPRLAAVLLALLAIAPAAIAAPTISTRVPAADAVVNSLTQISVTFSEAVTGVDANDLLLNNDPAQTVTGSGAGPYVFGFTQPAPGNVNISWDFDHGISGIGTGAYQQTTWAYTLIDTLPPTVAKITTSVVGQELDAITPTPGSTVSTLTRVEVLFSEAVTGVDAGDLLVNGTPATDVTGSDAGPYVFTFPQPATGAVTFSWAANHGIQDTAATPNAFVANTWNNTLSAVPLGTLYINEFLAANATSIVDEDANGSSWIELYNPGPNPVSLLGWNLTDDLTAPTMWVFPNRTLAANSYLVLFASAKDRKPLSGNLHTNFKLNPTGGTLAIFSPDMSTDGTRTPVFKYDPYPSQRFDYTYGRQTDGQFRYYAKTGAAGVDSRAGAANPNSTLTSFTPKPNASVSRGFFKDPFQLVLTCTDPTATIRYTIDGSDVIASSPAYTAPLTVSSTRLLRMAAFGTNAVPSVTVTHSYIYLDQVLTQPSPPYDNPARTGDETNPQPPNVGGVAFPVAWGTATGQLFPGQITNLNTDQIPADYGMDPEILNDPNKYDDNGVINNATGRTNLDRIKQGLRDLPAVSIVMKNDDMFGSAGLYPNSTSKGVGFEKPCSIEFLLPDGTTGFATTCGIRIHGNASRSPQNNPKHGFKLNFKGDFGASNLDYPLFPDSAVHQFDDIILRGDYNSSWTHWDGSTGLTGQRLRGTRLRDAFCKDSFRAMGRVAGHHRYVNLFINGIYWGTYDPTEQENAGFAAAYFGGSKDDYDVVEQGGLKSGTLTAYNTMAAIASPIDNTKYEQMKGLLDVPEFIDYMLLHFWVGHQDWGDDINKNWYAARNKKNGTFKYFPWDQENLLWDPAVDRTTVAMPPTGLHPKLVTNPQYLLDFADRVNKNVVSPDGALQSAAAIARWNKWRAIISNAIACESARWGDYRRDVHRFNSSGPNFDLYTWNNHWITENNRLTNTYFPTRNTNPTSPTVGLMPQLRSRGLYPMQDAPELRNNATNALAGSQRVSAGYALKLQMPATASRNTSGTATTITGTIYYTTDGSDPRIYYTGAIATPANGGTAQLYTAGTPIVINATKTIRARSLTGTTSWSALAEAAFTVDFNPSPIRFTEIMYHPSAAQGGDAGEFIELQNTSTQAVNLGGWSFSGIDFVFPNGYTIGAGSRIVLASNNAPSIFSATYPGVAVAGYFSGSLDNGGERLGLYDASGRLVVSVDYHDSLFWPQSPDGAGNSLEIIDPNADPNDPANWKASAVIKGTPGQANSTPTAPMVELSEVFTAPGATGFVELHNKTGSPVDISSWQVRGDTFLQTIPAGTTLATDGYYTFQPTLSQVTGQLVLNNASGVAVDVVAWGPQVTGYSIGRVNGSWVLNTPSQGAPNVAAVMAPATSLALNEWLANPVPGYDDWLEVYNKDASLPIALQGLYFQAGSEIFHFQALAFVGGHQWVQLFANNQGGGNRLDFRLPAAGATLAILSSAGASIDSVTYGVQAEGVSSGRLPDGTGAVVAFNGSLSPGAANYLASNYSGPVLNEVLVRNVNGAVPPWATQPSWVEFQNNGGASFDMSGMKLNNVNVASGSGTVWTFPAGSVVGAGKRLVVWADPSYPASTTASANLNSHLALSGSSDGLYLFNAANQLINFVEWGPQVADLSIGRIGATWQLLAAPTLGTVNSAAADPGSASNLRINEWAANLTAAADWVELYNNDTKPVALTGLYLSDDPSETGRTKFHFSPLSFIGGHDWTQLIADNAPELGRTHLPFTLDATGEYLRLSNNDATVSPIDTVSFGLQGIAATEGRLADGSTTIVSGLRPTPGGANSTSNAPAILDQPHSLVVVEGGSANFTVTAAGAATLAYQWQKNNSDVQGAQSSALSLGPLTLGDEGSYTCIVTNGSGTVTSKPATLRVYRTLAQALAASGLSGPNADPVADPETDGMANALEAFLNTNPATDGAADRSAFQVGIEPTIGTPQYLTITYRRNSHLALSDFFFEGSPSLGGGTWAALQPDVVESLAADPITGDPKTRVKFSITSGEVKKFLRLQVVP